MDGGHIWDLGLCLVYGRHFSIVSLSPKESLCLTQSFDYLNIKAPPPLASDLVTCLEGKRRQIGFSMLCHLAPWVNMSPSNWHFKVSELMCLESCPVFRGHSFLIFPVSLSCLGLCSPVFSCLGEVCVWHLFHPRNFIMGRCLGSVDSMPHWNHLIIFESC